MLPNKIEVFMDWTWEQILPHYEGLQNTPLTAENVEKWLREWTQLSELVDERFQRLYVATTSNTADTEAEQRFNQYRTEIFLNVQSADNHLKQKFLASQLEVVGFEIPRLNMQTDAEIFRETNLPLFTDVQRYVLEFNRTIGAQTVAWNGEEVTLIRLELALRSADRNQREQAYRLQIDRQLADREKLNGIWVELLKLRQKIAENANLPDYRAYAWRDRRRYDYTPEDCLRFHDSIETVVVPAARRLYERRHDLLGIEVFRPWDELVDPFGNTPLRPFEAVDELVSKTAAIFQKLDPQLGMYFDTMCQKGLLDLDNRKGKAPGGYCTWFATTNEPFIFMNAVGVHRDIIILLHEAGHAFHTFEKAHLPYIQQSEVPMEFAEVPSQAMELLPMPFLAARAGGFYDDHHYARAYIESLERIIRFWPYMAVVDAFQHWAYTHYHDALNPDNCDEVWGVLWDRFMVGIDYSGLEDHKVTGWHRKQHIFRKPFYYIEYGIAYLGAVQIWKNSLEDQPTALKAYRRAISLGGTLSLPALYEAANTKFAFDVALLQEAVGLIEAHLETLAEALN